MSRKKKIVIGTLAGILLAVFGVLVEVLLAGMLQKITQYRAQHQELAARTSWPKL